MDSARTSTTRSMDRDHDFQLINPFVGDQLDIFERSLFGLVRTLLQLRMGCMFYVYSGNVWLYVILRGGPSP